MSFPAQILDHQKQNCLQKCFYMMNLIKNKSPELWEMYQPVYSTLSVDESWEFYQVLVNEYKDLLEAPPMRAPTKKKTMSKKTATKKK